MMEIPKITLELGDNKIIIQEGMVNLEGNNIKFNGGLSAKEKYDMVDHPKHYNQHKVETIDIIESILNNLYGEKAFEAYCLGNVIKYLDRCEFKENKKQDLEKAKWYTVKGKVAGYHTVNQTLLLLPFLSKIKNDELEEALEDWKETREYLEKLIQEKGK